MSLDEISEIVRLNKNPVAVQSLLSTGTAQCVHAYPCEIEIIFVQVGLRAHLESSWVV